MRIVFFGTPEFAVNALKLLHKNHEIALVVTQPDRQKGRNLRITPPAVKTAAAMLNLKVFQPEDLNSVESLKVLKDAHADLFVVVSFGKILNKKILELPKKFAVNLHASLLPKYRGAAPVNYALLRGDKITGVTIMRMNEYMDKGDIILQKELAIEEDDNAEVLFLKLSSFGAQVLNDAIGLIQENKTKFIAQNEQDATYAPSLKKEDAKIDWAKKSMEIKNLIRAMMPWPGSYTFYQGRMLKVFKCRIWDEYAENKDAPCGTIIGIDKQEGLIIKTGSGALIINELQLESSRRMRASQFLAGHSISVNEKLG